MQAKKLWWIGLFAIAMAYVESAVVVYLRRIYSIDEPTALILSYDPLVAPIEVGREAATLIMLLAIGWAIGRSRETRLGFAVFAFGVWDMFYYVWLKVLIDWPASVFTPDILFLIPLPWWGPVLSPLLVAVLMTVVGALVVIGEDQGRVIQSRPVDWVILSAGMLAVLYTFMADAIAVLPADTETLTQLRPTAFNWPLYLAGLGLMTFAAGRVAWRSAKQHLLPCG